MSEEIRKKLHDIERLIEDDKKKEEELKRTEKEFDDKIRDTEKILDALRQNKQSENSKRQALVTNRNSHMLEMKRLHDDLEKQMKS